MLLDIMVSNNCW